MEISELDRKIQKCELSGAYFFYGEEQFLIENKLAAIKKKLIDGDFEELNYSKLEGKKVSAQEVITELLAVPVMADYRMIVVKNSGLFGNAKLKDFARLTEELAALPPYICIIFTETEFDKKKEKNLEVFKKYGGAIKFDFLSPARLEVWIEKKLEAAEKTILNRDIRLILERCGQSMSIINNETDKLLHYLGDRQKVTEEDVSAVVSKTCEARIFDMIDNAASGRSDNLFAELSALKSAGENPSVIITLISGRFSELLLLKQLMNDKMSAAQAAEYLEPKRPGFVVNKLINQAKSFSEEYLREMTLLGLDYTAKVRSSMLDKWAAVEMYVAKIC